MPKVYRSMKKSEDGLPTLEASPKGLGVRDETDIHIDESGNVILDGCGMSVAPDWRKLRVYRIPQRLHHIVQGARGPNNVYCFSMGTGPFESGNLAAGLDLRVDSTSHGTVVPTQVVPLIQYKQDIANTRTSWQIDEN